MCLDSRYENQHDVEQQGDKEKLKHERDGMKVRHRGLTKVRAHGSALLDADEDDGVRVTPMSRASMN